MASLRENTSGHIGEDILSRYILDPVLLGEAAAGDVESHLKACLFCTERVEKLRAFYGGIEVTLREDPTAKDSELAASLVSKKDRTLPERGLERKRADERVIEAYAEVLAPGRPPLPLQVLRIVRQNPIKSAGGMLIFLAALLMLIKVSPFRKDVNPTFAEIKNYILFVYNKDGEVIWKRGVPGLPDWRSDTPLNREGSNPERFLIVAQAAEGGTNAVLLTGSTYEGEFARDTLYCFGATGELRWKCGIGSMISFGKAGEYGHSRGGIIDFACFRRTQSSAPRLFVISSEETFSPSKLCEVRLADGAIVHSFYNRGGLRVMRHLDLDGDGVEEILVGGVNDGYNKACLAVLDPDLIDGYAPVPSVFTPAGLGAARLKFYLLFPYSPFPSSARTPAYGTLVDLASAPGRPIQANVREWLYNPDKGHNEPCSMYFGLDSSLAATNVTPDDVMTLLAGQYVGHPNTNKVLDRSGYNALRDSLEYWDGDRFVRTPTEDKHFRSPFIANRNPSR